MRVYTRLVLDSETFEVLQADAYEWSGEVALCKGGASRDEQRLANQQMQQQNALTQQMLNFQLQRFGKIDASLDPIIAAGGLPPEVETAMRSTILQRGGDQFAQLMASLSNRERAAGVTGGEMAGGGDLARRFGGAGAAFLGEQTRQLNEIPMAKYEGLMRALAIQGNIGSQFGQNLGTFNQGAGSALGTGQRAAQAADEASTSFWGSLIGAAGGMGQKAMGKWF